MSNHECTMTDTPKHSRRKPFVMPELTFLGQVDRIVMQSAPPKPAGGFIGDGDKRLLAQVRGTPPHLLAKAQYAFRDSRLPELLFRYRARNWPDSLLPAERSRWDDYRRLRLQADNGLSETTFGDFNAEIAQLRIAHAGDGRRLALLDRLQAWGDGIAQTLE